MKPLPPMTRHLATHGLHEDVHERPPGLVPGHVLHTGRRLPRVLVLIRPEHLLDEGFCTTLSLLGPRLSTGMTPLDSSSSGSSDRLVSDSTSATAHWL